MQLALIRVLYRIFPGRLLSEQAVSASVVRGRYLWRAPFQLASISRHGFRVSPLFCCFVYILRSFLRATTLPITLKLMWRNINGQLRGQKRLEYSAR